MKKSLLFLFIFGTLSIFSFAQLFDGFDYAKQGTDWDYESCTTLKSRTVMNLSPIDFNPKDGKEFPGAYYFFPKYIPTEAKVNPYNITVELNATEEFGKTYTMTSGMQVGIYQATSLRFHSEAEHLIEGKRYPLELQIYHQVNI